MDGLSALRSVSDGLGVRVKKKREELSVECISGSARSRKKKRSVVPGVPRECRGNGNDHDLEERSQIEESSEELASRREAAGSYDSQNRCLREGESLIPGLPNEVAIDSILTRLPWKSLYTISALNLTWQWAFKTGQVHTARESVGQAHTLVAMTNASPFSFSSRGGGPTTRMRAISLYDPSQDSWCLLPPIPGVKEGIPVGGECVSLKGKLYVIGGFTPSSDRLSGDEMFCFDLGSFQGGWRRCAKLESPREGISCHVQDGKIYACGGSGYDQNMCRKSYVYHPDQDFWTPIADMLCKRSGQKMVGFGGGLYIHGGRFWSDRVDAAEVATSSSSGLSAGLSMGGQAKSAYLEPVSEKYDPDTGTWAEVENFAFGRATGTYLVSPEGSSLYHVSAEQVDKYNVASKTWERVHLNLWRVLEKVEVFPLWPCAAAFVDGELYILMASEDRSIINGGDQYRVIPLKSIGFGKEIVLHWQEIGCPFGYGFGVFGEADSSIHHVAL
ncbi:hypothetical protein R1flu_018329 [Riccia fluitans]|uniref:F-box/kelch-repeat protein n=1 Tax=Riccia fluitans TaxID=41844 RepID=A0ABD1ZGZ5_9MARC